VDNQRNRRDFYLTSAVPDSTLPRHEKAWLAIGVLAAMVLVVQLGWLSLLPASLWAAGLMVATRCCSAGEARAAIDWRVLLVIGAALAVGESMRTTGAAESIAQGMIALVEPMGLIGLLLGVHLLAMLFTETIGHVGAAALVYPIALESAKDAGIDPASPQFVPFIVVIMIAASASFATPTGYQTNLMVFGPGGYRFSDYVRFGLPLNLLVMAVTVALAGVMW
jgi:di/tricarboxylate transporter